jgi:hypothetical protein
VIGVAGGDETGGHLGSRLALRERGTVFFLARQPVKGRQPARPVPEFSIFAGARERSRYDNIRLGKPRRVSAWVKTSAGV